MVLVTKVKADLIKRYFENDVSIIEKNVLTSGILCSRFVLAEYMIRQVVQDKGCFANRPRSSSPKSLKTRRKRSQNPCERVRLPSDLNTAETGLLRSSAQRILVVDTGAFPSKLEMLQRKLGIYRVEKFGERVISLQPTSQT